MFPGMNERSMKSAMQKMGISQKELDVTEVIFTLKDKRMVIRKPSVIKVNMMGSDVYQVSGAVEEEDLLNEEDIKTVAEQAGVTAAEAKAALKETGDLAEAILKLKGLKI